MSQFSRTINSAPASPEEEIYRTEPDGFGIFREYARRPRTDPEAGDSLESVSDAPGLDKPTEQDVPKYSSIAWITRAVAITVNPTSSTPDYGPFKNASQFRLMDYFYGRSDTKSLDALDDLIAVIRSPGFSPDDLEGFSARTAEHALDVWVSPSGIFSAQDGWHESSVEVSLPKTGAKYKSEEDAPKFPVVGLIHRKLLPLIKSIIQDTASRFSHAYHWFPHRKFWSPPGPGSCTSFPTEATPSTGTSSASTQSSSSTSSSAKTPSQPERASPPCPIRVYTDCYNSNAMLEADAAIRMKPRVPGDAPGVEYVILPLLLWSDATLLSNFGSASLWPIYLYFGSLSKYVRGRPTEFAAHHLAYIPGLPDALKDFYMATYGRSPSKDTLKFCKREIFQQVWLQLLDAEFMEAYEHGILLTCGDGVIRRVFPRIFTYSADYPEKVLIAAMKPLARCLCPRCLMPKDKVAEAGSKADDQRRRNCKRQDTKTLQANVQRARKNLFKGFSINGTHVTNWTDAESLTPIQSAFSARLSPFGVNFYEILAPDLMHEFELGVWKGVFTHLMRMLAAKGDDAVEEFNSRMRRMPTFGRDRIRRFWHDVSSRKRLAARDYEAFLITIMPAFEGLLDLRDDETVADLLFELANWHALAKLRLHTAVTLDIFRAATSHMYKAIRRFAETTCPRYATKELPSEAAARVRRAKTASTNTEQSTTRKATAFTVHHTYKFHSLGDYPEYIERSGTTDNFNTQVGELEHRHVKRFYARTNRVAYELQIARKERKRSLLASIRQRDSFRPLSAQKQEKKRAKIALAEARGRSTQRPHPPAQIRSRALSPTPPHEHYAVSKSHRQTVDLYQWLGDNQGDPAVADFMPLLFEHVVRRLLGREAEPEEGFSEDQLHGVQILNHRLYRHSTIRINYTSYDMRREQDTINPRTHADIMVLSPDNDSNPYWFARVISIFHANVRYVGPGATRATQKWQRIDFVWVRWFERDTSYPAGFQHRRLPRLHFVDATDPDYAPFGFVDPDDIIRGAYLIPGFEHGSTTDLLGPSKLARRLIDDGDDDDDYCYHYVCMFVEHDVYMRHLGGGVGHRGVGIDVDTSRQHASRISRRGAHKRRSEGGARVANTAQPLLGEDSEEGATGSEHEDDAEDGADGRASRHLDFGDGSEANGGENRTNNDSRSGSIDGDEDGESKSEEHEDEDDEQHESESDEREDHGDEEDIDDGMRSDDDKRDDDADPESGDEDVYVDTVYAAEGFAPL
ncbi:hypothetical protein GSI_01982 [Ganoderma sinense ZZ0214-1]|uniref:Uncharacterized protein n=1 Tax=Ganoderma sinense ZZ0214-1 TaxID=1077348 RepID=A0A2G8SNA6_9APHY|nr:hypothetical protein GSI_01982 [Ganoderma sinense ZZ0214-1]